MGRLTKPFQVVKAGKGVVSKSSIAYPRKQKNKNGEFQTDFIDIYIWGESFARDKASTFYTGQRVLVSGDLEVDRVQDANGNWRVFPKIKCDSYWGCVKIDYPKNNNYNPQFNESNNYGQNNQYYGNNNQNGHPNNNGYNQQPYNNQQSYNNQQTYNNQQPYNKQDSYSPNEDLRNLNPMNFTAIGDDDDIPF